MNTGKRILTTFVIAFVLLISSLNANGDEDYIKKGNEAYKNFNNSKALEFYLKAYKVNPNNYYVMLNLSNTYNSLGEELKEKHNFDEAKKYIDKAVEFAENFHKVFPDSAETYTQLALSYGNYAMYVGGNEKIKMAKKIEKNAKIAIQKNPDNYFPYIILGIYYREIANLSWFERTFANAFFGDVPDGSFQDAEKMFKKALEIKPDMIVATYQLSKVYRFADEEEKEMLLLKKLIDYPVKDFRDKFAIEKSKRRLKELI